MKVNINNCARCGETHVDLEFSKLTRPMIDAKHTHWAMCPTVNEPIMLRIVASIDEELKEPELKNCMKFKKKPVIIEAVSYTHLRAHET